MSETLRVAFLILMWAGILTMQYNHELDTTATRNLKNALELAVHDASLPLDKYALSEGNIVFDQDCSDGECSETNFQKSLQENLKLDTSLAPLDDSFLQTPLEIKHFEYIDDSNAASYPFNYTNPTYDIFDTVYGPSIVAVVETMSPRYFDGTPQVIRQAVVYEYRIPD